MKLSLSSLAIVGIAVFLPSATGHLRPIPQASLSVEDEADHYQVSPASNLAQLQDQTMLSELSQPLDVEDTQVQAQGRRLESDALQAFQARCDATTTSGETGSNAYVDCIGGFVRDINTDLPTSQTCAAACDGECCTGGTACGIVVSDGTVVNGFTGKGKSRRFILHIVLF